MDETYNKEMNMEALSSQGFPFCPECGAELHWESDYMLSELGYIEPTEGEELDPNDKCVNVLTYPHCGLSFEVENDTEMNLLCVITPKENDDDEPNFKYTEYAIKKYNHDEEGV